MTRYLPSQLFSIPNRWNFVTKLLLTVLLATVLPLGLYSCLNTINLQRTLRSNVEQRMVLQTNQIGSELGNYLAQNTSLLETLSFNPTVLSVVSASNINNYAGMSANEIEQYLKNQDQVWREESDGGRLVTQITDSNTNLLASLFRRYNQQFSDHVEILATDRNGGTVASNIKLSDFNQSDEAWWQAAHNNGQGAIYISEPELDENTEVWAIKIAYPIIVNDRLLGILRTTLSTQLLGKLLESYEGGKTGNSLLVDMQDGGMLAEGDASGGGALEGLQSYFGKGVEKIQYVEVEGQQLILVSEDVASRQEGINEQITEAIGRLEWNVFSYQATSEAFTPIRNATLLAILSGVLGLLIASGFAYWLAQYLTTQIQEIQRVVTAVEAEDFDQRAQVMSEDELGQLALGLNTMLDRTTRLVQTTQERDQLQHSIMQLLDEVSAVAEGDLTSEAEVRGDLTGAIADSFNYMIEQLRIIINRVQETSLQLSASANEIQTTAEHLTKGSEAQAEQILNTTAAIDEMSVSIQQVSENSAMSATVGEQARINARKGREAVKNTIQGMERIQGQVQESARRIQRLNESSKQISDIAQVINDIADRTSILALNASIQAAMAGEAGRGFAVVAEEVERLSERSAMATKQIESLIRTIQNETGEAIQGMQMMTREVNHGAKIAQGAGEALGEIEQVSDRLAELIQAISLAAKQQARGSEAIAQSMNEIADVTQQNAAGTKEASHSIANLAQLAESLRDSVSQFNVGDYEHVNGYAK